MLTVDERTVERLKEINLVELDDIIDSYDYDTDSALQSDEYQSFETTIWQKILDYGKDTPEMYGRRRMAPHLKTAAREIAALLCELGFSKNVQKNSQNAFKFHDFGKTHKGYDINIWSLPHRPTEEEKIDKKKHHILGPDMWFSMIENLSDKIKNHPHVSIVVPALMAFHHEKLNGKGARKRKSEELGTVIRAACIVDAYCGDIVKRPHQEKPRTPGQAILRMADIGDIKHKYKDCFDTEILAVYSSIVRKNTGRKLDPETAIANAPYYLREEEKEHLSNTSK